MAERKKKKKKKKADKKRATKVILSTDEEIKEAQDLDEEDIDEEDEEGEGGIYLEKEDVLVIYKALKNYKPVNDDEEMTHELLVEQFEETLVIDYKVKLPGVSW
jgi:hypothetical protein